VRHLHGAAELERRHLRPSTQLIYNRGVADFAAFCNKRGVLALLAPSDALRAYIYQCTTDHRLYAQIVKGRMHALGDWHNRQPRALVCVRRHVLGNHCSAPPVAKLMAMVRHVCTTGYRGRLRLTTFCIF
jgi:hypothetical protein